MALVTCTTEEFDGFIKKKKKKNSIKKIKLRKKDLENSQEYETQSHEIHEPPVDFTFCFSQTSLMQLGGRQLRTQENILF